MSDTRRELVHEEVTRSIIGAFFYVYNYLGFGFLESVYAAALAKVLRARGHLVEREVLVDVWFEDEVIAKQRVDMVVDHKVVVEVKASERLPVTARSQLTNYLVAARMEVGLLLHFGPRPAFFREYKSPGRHHPTGSAQSDRSER